VITSRCHCPWHQRFHPSRLTGFGPAQLNLRARIGFGGEIMIEADNAVHFGAAEIERLGYFGFG